MKKRTVAGLLLAAGLAAVAGYVFRPEVLFLATAAVLFAAAAVLARKARVPPN